MSDPGQWRIHNKVGEEQPRFENQTGHVKAPEAKWDVEHELKGLAAGAGQCSGHHGEGQ